MLFGGIDIGSRAAKVVVMEDDQVSATAIIDTGPESAKTARKAMETALEGTGRSISDLGHTVATGYGRVLVPFANENISEISCHAKGINWHFPTAKTILDMGGQDCKAISVNGGGRVENFIMNDKCAGGTGRFLEMIADVLNTPLEEIGDLALASRGPILFNTVCAVFARTEAIKHLRKGVKKADIMAGLHEAIAVRSVNLLKRVSIRKDFAISGGIAKNAGMVRKLAEKVGLEPLLADDPQLVGALGAALFARERHRGARPGGMKIQYGYSDGTGEYFVTVDTALCTGCGECVEVCPADIFRLEPNDAGEDKAVVKAETRKKLAVLCPGADACLASNGANCHSVCEPGAVEHTW